ncbi:MAG: hypothetical protein ACK478_00715 [Flavobacteriales bacterium]|jgi:hypothetical protein
MRLQTIIWFFAALLAFGSCKKEAGDGGNSSIKGKISRELRVVLNNPTTVTGTFPAADEDVYIIYDNHVSPDDRVQTNYDGEYEFLYLRPGKYTVYAFSKDTNAVAVPWDEDHMTVLQELEITDGNQQVMAADMTIYDAN